MKQTISQVNVTLQKKPMRPEVPLTSLLHLSFSVWPGKFNFLFPWASLAHSFLFFLSVFTLPAPMASFYVESEHVVLEI